MAILQIRQAERAGARLVIGLSGISGQGKTFTALQIAYGMTGGDGSKVGFLDTENRRGSLYASHSTYAMVQQSLGLPTLPTPFLIGDLHAPFSPQRYIDAIHEFQKAGVEVLVIDSVTHEWEGTGGCEEIATITESRMADWKKAKSEHKRFMNALLQSDMHVIVCIRAREKMDFANPKKPVSLGVQPVQEKNFMFEMTASLMMWNEGTAQQVLKCPNELKPILGRGGDYITARDGAALRAWVDGAAPDDGLGKWRNRLQSITEQGEAVVRDAWGKCPEKVRTALGEEFLSTLLSSASAYDRMREDERRAETGSSNVDDINSMVGDDDSEDGIDHNAASEYDRAPAATGRVEEPEL